MTNIILALLSRHPVDRIQYIIKKMRIDLCLQSLEFNIFVNCFHLHNLFYQLLYFLYRLVENRIHGSNLIPSSFRKTDRKVTLRKLLHCFTCTLDRTSDSLCQNISKKNTQHQTCQNKHDCRFL